MKCERMSPRGWASAGSHRPAGSAGAQQGSHSIGAARAPPLAAAATRPRVARSSGTECAPSEGCTDCGSAVPAAAASGEVRRLVRPRCGGEWGAGRLRSGRSVMRMSRSAPAELSAGLSGAGRARDGEDGEGARGAVARARAPSPPSRRGPKRGMSGCRGGAVGSRTATREIIWSRGGEEARGGASEARGGASGPGVDISKKEKEKEEKRKVQ